MTQLQVVETFRAPDGALFTDREKAERYILSMQYHERASRYADSVNTTAGSKTRIVNIVKDFLAFEELSNRKAETLGTNAEAFGLAA